MYKKIIIFLVIFLFQSGLLAVEKKVIYDFENDKEISDWDVSKGGKLELSTENVTSGKKSMKVSLPVGEYPGISLRIPKGKTLDWSKYDYLKFDLFVLDEEGISFEIRIDDDKSISEEPNDVWATWCSISKVGKPNKNEIEVDLTLLTVNDKSRNLNTGKITKFVIFMLGPSSKKEQTFFIDNIRLEKD